MTTTYPTNPASSYEDWKRQTGASRQYTEQRQFCLIWQFGNVKQVVYTGTVELCQHQRSLLKRQRQYSGGMLVIRTVDGFKNNPEYQKI